MGLLVAIIFILLMCDVYGVLRDFCIRISIWWRKRHGLGFKDE